MHPQTVTRGRAVPVHRVPAAHVRIELWLPAKPASDPTATGGCTGTAPIHLADPPGIRPEGYASIRDRSSVAAELEMNSLRGATSLPINRSNTCSDASRSEMLIRRSVRNRGSIVVSAS